MTLPADPLHPLWATPIGVHQWAEAADANALLARAFSGMRATDPNAKAGALFYASADNLLNRIQIPEWQSLIRSEFTLIRTGSSDYHGTRKPNQLGENTTASNELERILEQVTGLGLVS